MQKEAEGKIRGVPSNDTIINAFPDNSKNINDSRSNLQTYQNNVADARDSVDEAEGQYRSSRDQEIVNAKADINGEISEQIDGVANLTTSAFLFASRP